MRFGKKHACRNADRSAPGRDIAQDHRVGPDARSVTDREFAKHFCSCMDADVVAERWPRIWAVESDRDLLVNPTIVADLACCDDGREAMLDEVLSVFRPQAFA